MTRTSTQDLNAYLFEQLDALSNDDLKGEALNEAIKRAESISDISGRIIENYGMTIKAASLVAEYGGVNALSKTSVTQLIELKTSNETKND